MTEDRLEIDFLRALLSISRNSYADILVQQRTYFHIYIYNVIRTFPAKFFNSYGYLFICQRNTTIFLKLVCNALILDSNTIYLYLF